MNGVQAPADWPEQIVQRRARPIVWKSWCLAKEEEFPDLVIGPKDSAWHRALGLTLAFPVLPHQNKSGRTALSFGHLLGCHRLDHNVA